MFMNLSYRITVAFLNIRLICRRVWARRSYLTLSLVNIQMLQEIGAGNTSFRRRGSPSIRLRGKRKDIIFGPIGFRGR